MEINLQRHQQQHIKELNGAFWGKDSKAVAQYKFDKEFLSSPETIDALTKATGSRDAALRAIESGDVQAFLNNNHTDPVKIGRALKKRDAYLDKAREEAKRRGLTGADAEKTAQALALQRAIGMTTWARDINPGVFNPNSREQVAWKKTLTDQLVNEGLESSKATQRVEEILKDLQDITG